MSMDIDFNVHLAIIISPSMDCTTMKVYIQELSLESLTPYSCYPDTHMLESEK